LGLLLDEGAAGVARDAAAAESWLRKAAAQGMSEAKDALRDMRADAAREARAAAAAAKPDAAAPR
jgi:TPR repeat protein